jgi:hypothetical protein
LTTVFCPHSGFILKRDNYYFPYAFIRVDFVMTTVYYAVKVKVPRNRPEGPEGGRGIALLFLDLGTRRGGWSAPRPGRFTPGKDPVPIVQEAG